MDKSEKRTLLAVLYAVLGGVVVAAAGLAAIGTGLVNTSGKGGTTVIRQAPIAKQVSSDDGLTVGEIYKKEGPGVVFIKAEVTASSDESDPFGFGLPQQRGIATGSGFVVDKEGFIITNAHVVEGADEVEVEFSDKDSAKAKVVGRDASIDIALVKVEKDGDDLDVLPLGNSDNVAVGDPVIAIGNPFGFERTVTTGIVSALQRQIEAPNGFSINDVLQTDASINPGNSGGPLLDATGRVIGVNSQIASRSGGSEGIGFAIPIDTVKESLPQLKETGSVERAYLGITGFNIKPDVAKSLNLPVSSGVLVQKVSKGSGAEKAGLKGGNGETQILVEGQPVELGGDIVVKVDGKEIKDMDQVVSIVNSKKPGDEIEVNYLRGGSDDEREATVTLGKRPDKLQQ